MLKTRQTKLLSLLLAFVFLLSLTGFAEAGTNPLNFVGACETTINGTTSTTGDSIIDSTAVPADAILKLMFDRNVVSDSVYNGETVWEHNQTCVVLKDSLGNTVDANIFRLGDVNFNERWYIFVDPTDDLVSSESYTISVDSSLIANNGLTMGYPVSINFTVE